MPVTAPSSNPAPQLRRGKPGRRSKLRIVGIGRYNVWLRRSGRGSLRQHSRTDQNGDSKGGHRQHNHDNGSVGSQNSQKQDQHKVRQYKDFSDDTNILKIEETAKMRAGNMGHIGVTTNHDVAKCDRCLISGISNHGNCISKDTSRTSHRLDMDGYVTQRVLDNNVSCVCDQAWYDDDQGGRPALYHAGQPVSKFGQDDLLLPLRQSDTERRSWEKLLNRKSWHGCLSDLGSQPWYQTVGPSDGDLTGLPPGLPQPTFTERTRHQSGPAGAKPGHDFTAPPMENIQNSSLDRRGLDLLYPTPNTMTRSQDRDKASPGHSRWSTPNQTLLTQPETKRSPRVTEQVIQKAPEGRNTLQLRSHCNHGNNHCNHGNNNSNHCSNSNHGNNHSNHGNNNSNHGNTHSNHGNNHCNHGNGHCNMCNHGYNHSNYGNNHCNHGNSRYPRDTPEESRAEIPHCNSVIPDPGGRLTPVSCISHASGDRTFKVPQASSYNSKEAEGDATASIGSVIREADVTEELLPYQLHPYTGDREKSRRRQSFYRNPEDHMVWISAESPTVTSGYLGLLQNKANHDPDSKPPSSNRVQQRNHVVDPDSIQSKACPEADSKPPSYNQVQRNHVVDPDSIQAGIHGGHSRYLYPWFRKDNVIAPRSRQHGCHDSSLQVAMEPRHMVRSCDKSALRDIGRHCQCQAARSSGNPGQVNGSLEYVEVPPMMEDVVSHVNIRNMSTQTSLRVKVRKKRGKWLHLLKALNKLGKKTDTDTTCTSSVRDVTERKPEKVKVAADYVRANAGFIADTGSREQIEYPYDVKVTRGENEGFGFVIISSVTRSGSVIGKTNISDSYLS